MLLQLGELGLIVHLDLLWFSSSLVQVTTVRQVVSLGLSCQCIVVVICFDHMLICVIDH